MSDTKTAPQVGDPVGWTQTWGVLPARIIGYDGLTGTWLLRAEANGMIGWVRTGGFERRS